VARSVPPPAARGPAAPVVGSLIARSCLFAVNCCPSHRTPILAAV
jgi:hypothetical protein